MAKTPDLLSAALFYAKLGWRVFPVHWPTRDPKNPCSCGKTDCKNVGKHPHIGNWPENASTDEATIRRWWKQWPAANIGVACGVGSNLWVLDVDLSGDGLEELQRLWDQHDDWPDTVKQTTGSGGFHYFFTHTPGLANAVKFLPGLDVRTEGGLVVLPPSLHVSGNRYQWSPIARPKTTPVAAAPAWLVDLARVKRQELVAAGVAEPVVEGSRNDRLFRDACAFRRRGMDEEVILAALRVENEKYCRPPLEEDELADIARKATRYQPEVETAATNGTHPPATADPAPLSRPRGFTAAELMRKRIEPTRYVVPGFFAEGLNLLCGPPKIGKSFLTMGVGVAVATPGGRAFGAIPTEHGSVLYLALEDGEGRLQKRLDLILGGSPGPEKLRFYDEWPAADAGGLTLLKEEMESFEDLRLVVIDVFGKIRAQQKPNGNVYQQDYREMAALKRLADEFRVCMVLIHHLNKGEHEDPLQQISGSMGLAGGADAVLILKRPRGRAEGYLFVTGRDVEEREVALEMAPEAGTWTFLGDANEYRRSAERKEILALLKDYPQGLQPLGIADALERNRNTIRSLLFRMVYDGEIRVVGGLYFEAGKGPPSRLF